MTNATSTLKAIYPDLEGRTVLISGGASGIGQSLVEAFSRQGAYTAFVDISSDAAQALEKKLNKEGGKVLFRHCDITDIRAWQHTIHEVAEQYGPITVLLNNAANDVRHKMEEIDFQRFDELVAVNLKHALFASKIVAPMMRQAGGGSIVNLGSFGWMKATPDYPIYAACKAGMHGMTRALARDLGSDGIRVNTLVPGWVMTEKQLQLWVDDTAREEIKRNQCLAGHVLPEHIAAMALFLASDASAMCSAQNFIVDGGWV